jgi:phage protein D
MAKSIDLKFIGEPNVMAGGIIKVEGVRNGIDGKWFVSQVEHLIDSRGFVSQAQCVLLS